MLMAFGSFLLKTRHVPMFILIRIEIFAKRGILTPPPPPPSAQKHAYPHRDVEWLVD